jgi:hypothetical protein
MGWRTSCVLLNTSVKVTAVVQRSWAGPSDEVEELLGNSGEGVL